MHSLRHILELTGGGLTVAGGAAGLMTYAALSSSSQLFGRTLIAGRNIREFALTYDDGPNDACTPSLLDLLAEHNVKATFFMIGKYVQRRKDLARRVLAEGHIVGNHTMSHPWLSVTAGAKVREEMRGCNAVLEDVLGTQVRYFRPPHGARRPVVFRVAHELGLEVVQWNSMGHDWEKIGVEAIVGNVRAGMRSAAKSGRASNILLHDGSHNGMGADRTDTLRATESLLVDLLAKDRRAVTVDKWDKRRV